MSNCLCSFYIVFSNELQRAASENIAVEIEQLQAQLDAQNQKRQFQRQENNRRKHNYLPFVAKLIEVLASENKLSDLMPQSSKWYNNQ